ncbi:MAG: efflux RND transporter permease subunit [Opitutales bacterium]|nr:efflux RND transporter permease subunit [Opitutales bacterium]MDP4645019.1 efflux RND transporter permease subunit [Opitutales bacterium]MDP4776944.1 efflux RND transporter permease subunit [Opitutales bacterium]MDP4883018.1 efflux RND transporter permease subunit [Opitutales bacterium]MDP5079919.1 efflux RND transporter permease subunit [Opitutales bacterium]
MIRWFTENGVAANLLAGIVIVAGLFAASSIKLELFPELDLDIVSVAVPYPGAAPEEVESGIIELIEDRIQDVEGIKKVTATAAEGYGSLAIEVERGYDATEIADKIKVRVDAIDNFPEEAEEPTVEELLIRNEVISLAIFGDTDPKTLKDIAEFIRDELSNKEGITQVDIKGIAEFEISINVSELSLRQYGLTFDHVVQAIRSTSIDIPGGSIKSRGGEILLRTTGKAYEGAAFGDIPVITLPDGSAVYVRDVATVDDGFVDDPLVTEFNGKRAVLLRIFAVGDQSALDVSAQVQAFAKTIDDQLPNGIEVEAFRDFTYYLKGRLQMLIENGIFGLILVFLVLTLFLRPSLAFFVMLGIPISFLGSMLFLPALGISINLASLFGFILVLGIVVDDAIIVGESVFTQFQKHGGPGVAASVAGTKKVSIPVTFAVLTTIVAFLPILTIPGFLGKFFFPIPVVVIATLIWSLIESKLVLPYHLTLCKVGGGDRENLGWLRRQQRKIADGLERFIESTYRPFLNRAIRFRYATAASFIGLLIIMIGMLVGKHLPFVFFPPVPSDYIVAKLVMPEGTPLELTTRAIQQMERGLNELIKETKDKGYGEPFDNAVITIGGQPFEGSGGPMGDSFSQGDTNLAEIAVELVKREDLPGGGDIEALSAPNLANRWRELIGPIPGTKEVAFNANAAGAAGMPIDIQLTGRDFKALQAASEAIKAKLATYEGLFDIKDNYSSGKREIQLDLHTTAEPLGLRQADLGRQVRAAFYGVEAQRIQRGRDDIKVMVRYPLDERRSVENLEDLRIRTPDGTEVPFDAVADFEITEGFSKITRIDRRRVLNIIADADKSVADLGLIKASLSGKSQFNFKAKLMFWKESEPTVSFLDEIVAEYPGVSWSFEGEAREQADIFASLQKMTFIALFIIYALLAVPLKSYIQPVIVMIVIPFGLIGAIGGHMLMGQPMSILSVLGFVALAGVVVNDSLVLVDFINQERAEGMPLREAIEKSGALRFRPIILTSLTTFAGLLPVLFEKSLQAQFLIPMAISLSFGVLFATFITLILVPAFYTILEDIREGAIRLFK